MCIKLKEEKENWIANFEIPKNPENIKFSQILWIPRAQKNECINKITIQKVKQTNENGINKMIIQIVIEEIRGESLPSMKEGGTIISIIVVIVLMMIRRWRRRRRGRRWLIPIIEIALIALMRRRWGWLMAGISRLRWRVPYRRKEKKGMRWSEKEKRREIEKKEMWPGGG